MSNPVTSTVLLLLIVGSFLLLDYGYIKLVMAECMNDGYSKYKEDVSNAKRKMKFALSLLLGTLAVAYILDIASPAVIWSY